MDEIRPELLKALDVVGLSWLTRLYNIVWTSGTVSLEWKTGVVVPFSRRGSRGCVPTTGDHTPQPPREDLLQVLERRVQLLVELQIQEEQCGFHPDCGTLDQLYTLMRTLEGDWEFAQPVHMCFVDLEKV